MIETSRRNRRDHFVVLFSHRFATNDAMTRFVQSVDQIINIADLANLKPVSAARRRAIPRGFTCLSRDDEVRAAPS